MDRNVDSQLRRAVQVTVYDEFTWPVCCPMFLKQKVLQHVSYFVRCFRVREIIVVPIFVYWISKVYSSYDTFVYICNDWPNDKLHPFFNIHFYVVLNRLISIDRTVRAWTNISACILFVIKRSGCHVQALIHLEPSMSLHLRGRTFHEVTDYSSVRYKWNVNCSKRQDAVRESEFNQNVLFVYYYFKN